MPPKPSRLQILQLEADFVVVDKPAGLLSIEAPGRDPRQSVVHAARALLEERGEPAEIYAVHRLDEETTGSLVLARNKEARAYFEKLFAAHRIERIYHAIVLGKPHPATGRIESRLRIDESGIVETTSEGGEPAITDYATVHVGRGHSVVACRLETGRRNQIRVQLADRGCPLVGDRKYGRHDPRFAEQPAPRTLLHATALGFVPPGRREPQNYVAPFPKDFARFLGEDVLRQLL